MSTPVGDDLHELKALVYRLAGDNAALAARLTSLEDRVEDQAVIFDEIEAAVTSTGAADHAGGEEESVLDLRRLVDWVHTNVAALLERRIPQTGGYPYWCRSWWQHPEAIARFEATRRSWEDATAPGPGNALVIYYEHLDHQLGVLCGDNGPFSGCTNGVHSEHSAAQPLGQHQPPTSYFTGLELTLEEPV